MKRTSSQRNETEISSSPSKRAKTEAASTIRPGSPIRGNDEKFNLARFFNDVINIKQINTDAKIAFILVNHIVPTLPPFLDAIEKLGRIALIIPKGSHKDQATLAAVQEQYGSALINNFIQNTGPDYRAIVDKESVEIIKKAIPAQDEKILIIDIGGYFATSLEAIKTEFKDRFLGVVEDTENGHQKYLQVVDKGLCPILSVARSELKKTEDYNVGKSIVEATGTLLRTNAHTMLERMSAIGVIGFGKIGRSIAEHLRQKNVRKVIVYDNDSIRAVEASSLGFQIVTKEKLLKKADAIFCATGRKSLVGLDFLNLKNNVFICSCTSADDEFDLSLLPSIAELAEEQSSLEGKQYTDKYYIEGDKRINLIHQGNAVNFIHGAVNGPYIYSVQAGLIIAAINIINSQIQDDYKEIQEISREDMSNIANAWLQAFEDYSHVSNFHLSNEAFVAKLAVVDDLTKALYYISFANDLYNNHKQREKIKPLIQFFYRSILSLGNNNVAQQLRHISTFYQRELMQQQPFVQDLDKLQCYNDAIENALEMDFLSFAEYLCKESYVYLTRVVGENVKANTLYNIMRVYVTLADTIKVEQCYESLKECKCDAEFMNKVHELIKSFQFGEQQSVDISSSPQLS